MSESPTSPTGVNGANSSTAGGQKPTMRPSMTQNRPGSASRRPGSSVGRPTSSAVTQRRSVVVTSGGSTTSSSGGPPSSNPTASRNIKTLWDVILETKKDVIASNSDPVESNVFVLGGERSGKSSIVHRILKREYIKDRPERSTALEFTFGKKDEGLKTYVANIWELAGGRSLVKLLKETVTAENIHTMIAVIVLDLTKPMQLFEDFIYFQYILSKITEDLYSVLKQKGSDIPDKMISRAKKRFGEQHEDM